MNIEEEEKRKPKLTEEKKKKKNKNKKKSKEFTFVLGTHWVFNYGFVGAVVKEFTQIGLNLIGLRCMSVTKKFLEAHLKKEGRNTFPVPVEEFVNRGSFVAIKLEGDDAVNKAYQLVSTKNKVKSPLWDYFWPLVYSSDSVQSAQEDAAMWFRTDSSNWKEEQLQRKYLTFFFPDGTTCGNSQDKVLGDGFQINFTMDAENQRFILIKPKAFQNGMMPELLSIIEKNTFILRGLKLVKKSESPHSVAWSDNSSSSGESDKEEFGIAFAVMNLPILSQREGFVPFGREWVSRDLVFVSEKGESLKFIDEFFKFGLVGWMDPTSDNICGGMFEPTLTGLLFEDDCD